VFCADDMLALGAIAAFRADGLSVPQDVGVIGLNDCEMAGWDGIDLTTIAQPVAQIAETAIALAVERVSPECDPEAAESRAHVLPCLIVERGTLRPLK